jgi:hypothetical protein
MAFHFLPRGEQYFQLFETAAENIVQAALALDDLVRNFTGVEAKAARIREIENQGDQITFQIITRLGKSIVTPIEREDILAIARHLDDIVDFIDASASRLEMYAVEQTTDVAVEFTEMIVQGAQELVKLMAHLHEKDVEQIRLPKVAINRLESDGDKLLRRAVAGLFTSGQDALTVIKWKEIYETLEEVTDRLESVANLIEGIIIKNT